MVALTLSFAHAADAPAAKPDAPPDGVPSPSIATSLPPDLAAFGGLRPALAARGVTFQLNYFGETLGNFSGGIKRGAIYQGRLELVGDVDLDKLLGWKDGAIHFNAYQIHGEGLSRYYVGNLLTTSYIEALASTRLYEAWFEQKFLDGKAALRVGQLAGDSEFILSNYITLFLNSTFGWPAITGSDLPSGGPAYPLATPGIRLKLDPTEQISILAGVYNGDPSGPGANDPQRRNRYGVNFRLQDSPFAIVEGQYKYGGKDALIPTGVAHLGVWRHFGSFADQRYDANGVSLASPASTGVARRNRGDYGVYAMVDQQIYRLPGDADDKGVGVFARMSGSPADRNLIDFYVDGGVNFNGVWAARPDDSFGIAAAYAHISPAVAGLANDAALQTGVRLPKRDYEALVELAYMAQIVPGWTLQPSLQYIIHPGGHAANAAGNGALKDAMVAGLRMNVKY